MTHQKELVDSVDDFGTMSDINVIPFIDIMLVMLIIFMVAAPLMLGGVHINLPKTTGTAMPRPENPLVVSLDAERRIYIDKEELTEEDKMEFFRKLALESESGEVFLRGDGEIKYAEMMDLMSQLGQAGFARVTLVTNLKSGKEKETKIASNITNQNYTGDKAESVPLK